MKKIIYIILFIIGLTCCTTTPLQNDNTTFLDNEKNILSECKLIRHKERMFWEIKTPTGSVFVLGTIHAGDSNLIPLQQKILDAINNSERFVGEISSDDWKRVTDLTILKMNQSIINDPLKTWYNKITKSEKQILEEILTNEELILFKQFDPWVIITSLQKEWAKRVNIATEYGVDFEVMRIINNMNLKIDGLEDPEVQIDILSFGTKDEQLLRLKEILKFFSSSDYIASEKKNTFDLYSAYINNNEDEIARIINSSSTEIEKKYNDALFKNRNGQWAKRFVKYVQMPGNTFIFAGVGHFCGQNSVFEYLGLSEK